MIWLLLETLLKKELIFNTISYSINLWIKNLLPSMFPFFIISDILIEYHITNYIPKWIKKTCSHLFKITEPSLIIFLLSSISGFPSNAKIIKTMYDKKEISIEEANHILLFTHFSNPLFILSTIAVLFLHQEQYGIIILISHYLGNIIIGILIRKKAPYPNYDYTENKKESQNFSTTLIKSIQKAIDTLLLILGTLTCFLIFSSLIIQTLNIAPYPSTILKGILEITMGLKQLSNLPIPDIYKVTISSMFISFGGLSVHLQIISQLIDTKISYHSFLIARIFHALISGFICFILYSIFFK